MDVTEKRIKIARSKSGIPCLWESYTEFDDLKRAIVIISKDGDIKNSVFKRQFGSKQSLVPIDEGDYVVKIFIDNKGKSVSVLEIKKIANTSNHAEMLLVYRDSTDESQGEQGNYKDIFANGIKAAEIKMDDKVYIASSLFEKESEKSA